jgi:hypothetical protein
MPNEPLPDDIRNVWQEQPVENIAMSMEEIRRRSRQFEKRIRNRNLREYLGGSLGLAVFIYYLFKIPGPITRTGSALVVVGLISIMVQVYRRATPASLPVDLALTGSLEFHRRELARQRDLLRSVLWWYIGPIFPGLVVFSAGSLEHHGSWWVFGVVVVIYVLVFGWVVRLNSQAAERLSRQIAELESLESQL